MTSDEQIAALRRLIEGVPRQGALSSPQNIEDGIQLMRAFLQIPDSDGRQQVIALAERLAGISDGPEAERQ